jgi:hypothetical protein
MKKCSWCGQNYPDEAIKCSVDGHDLAVVTPAAPPLLGAATGYRPYGWLARASIVATVVLLFGWLQILVIVRGPALIIMLYGVAVACVASLAVMRNSRPSFARYVYARLGPGSLRQCLGHMFSRAFGASDFSRFWQYWNPFLGYIVSYFCYAPLRRFAPRPVCLIFTFALNGLLFHDLIYLWPFGLAMSHGLPFPVFTLALVTNAVIILTAERRRHTLAHLSLHRRVVCHLLAFFGPFAFSVGILLLTRI